jgi:hypothetical protein
MEEDKELGPAVTVYHLRHAAGDGEGRSSSWCRRVAYSPTTTDGNGRHVHHRVLQRTENHQQENSIHSPAAVSQGLWICPRYVCMSRMFNRDLIHPHSQPFHGLGLASLLFVCVCVWERERERERERASCLMMKVYCCILSFFCRYGSLHTSETWWTWSLEVPRRLTQTSSIPGHQNLLRGRRNLEEWDQLFSFLSFLQLPNS